MNPRTPPTSRDMDGPNSKRDTERDTREAVVEDAEENDDKDRDLVHGDGGSIGIDPDVAKGD